MVDALASGVSVLTDVRVQVPLFAPNNHMIYIALSIDAKVAELVDALASGVSVLTDVRVQVPLFAPRKISDKYKIYMDNGLINRVV